MKRAIRVSLVALMLFGMVAGASATPVAADSCKIVKGDDNDDVDVTNSGGNVVVDYEDRSDDDGYDDKDGLDLL